MLEAPPQRLEFLLIFDGGSLNNPGRGYGSFRLSGPGVQPQVKRMEYGNPITNNEAEYLALISGLEYFHQVLRAQSAEPGQASLKILGDSALVINQLAGFWKVRNAHLRDLSQRAGDLLRPIGHYQLTWHPRLESVRVLGH